MRAAMFVMTVVSAISASLAAAHASGGFSCEVEDARVRIVVESGVTHGMGAPTFNFRGEAEIKAGAVGAELRLTKFEETHRPQYWLGDGELRLGLYRELEADRPHGFVAVVIRAKLDDEGGAAGTYELKAFEVPPDGGDAKEFAATGPIACFVE